MSYATDFDATWRVEQFLRAFGAEHPNGPDSIQAVPSEDGYLILTVADLWIIVEMAWSQLDRP